MARQRNILIVIADGEHARLVRAAPDNALHTRCILNAPTAGLRSSQLGSDRPGATFHSGSSAHHAVAPRHDLHQMEHERFSRTVAARINNEVKKDPDLELVIAAPPDTLSVIQECLTLTTESRLLGTLAKDLAKVPDDHLQPHLKSWIQPVHHTPL